MGRSWDEGEEWDAGRYALWKRAVENAANGKRGQAFRSRLEARWAVFFDRLGVEYDYEKEGFELGGTRYLPDFWLRKMGVWVEIKPQREPEEEEWRKVCLLAQAHSAPVVVLCGDPWPNEYTARCVTVAGLEAVGRDPWRLHRGALWQASFAAPATDGMKCVPFPGAFHFLAACVSEPRGAMLLIAELADEADLVDAFNAARSARFEHGETPQTR